jgi:hypothetical protein
VNVSRFVSVIGLAAAALTAPACRSEEPAPAAAPSASAVPVDRLAKGELAPGTESMYGLVLPKGMSITGRFPKSIHAAGRVSAEELANYVRARTTVSRVELGAARTIFPGAKIKAGDQSRTYQIEVVGGRNDRSALEIEDVTEPKVTPGLDDAQRLRQVGLTPDGKLLDRSKLE